jgi:molecular chaperone HscB
MNADPDYFALFALPRWYAIDVERLDAAYRERARRVHPDRHTQHSAAVQVEALTAATELNTAYRTLKDPVLRASHLLALRGVDPGQASPTPALLMRQMSWHEALDAARQDGDGEALGHLGRQLRAQLRACEDRLATELNSTNSYRDIRFDRAKPESVKPVNAKLDSACGHLLEFSFLRRLLDAVVDASEEIATP